MAMPRSLYCSIDVEKTPVDVSYFGFVLVVKVCGSKEKYHYIISKLRFKTQRF